MADLSISARRSASRRRTQRSRSTFIVEAMLLLVCLLIVLAASMSLFAFAWQQGGRAADEQRAITLAQNAAERFAANPFNVAPTEEIDGFEVRTQMDWEPSVAGQMVHATIVVTRAEEPRAEEQEPVFELRTARYVSADAEGALVEAREVRP